MVFLPKAFSSRWSDVRSARVFLACAAGVDPVDQRGLSTGRPLRGDRIGMGRGAATCFLGRGVAGFLQVFSGLEDVFCQLEGAIFLGCCPAAAEGFVECDDIGLLGQMDGDAGGNGVEPGPLGDEGLKVAV